MSDKPIIEVLEDDENGPDHSKPAYDANDPEQVNLRRRKSGRKAKERRDFVTFAMSRKDGRDWIWELLTRGSVFGTTFSNDALVMAFREGRRDMALWILSQVQASAPEALIQAMQENAERREG